MMDKVKVSKELKEVLDDAIIKFTEEEILKIQSREGKWRTHAFKKLNNLSSIEMAEILIKGYEAEETPEEKLLNYLKIAEGDIENAYHRGISFGIRQTLRCLNIKIKGIND